MLRINFNKAGALPVQQPQIQTVTLQGGKFVQALDPSAQHLIARPGFSHGISGYAVPAAGSGLWELITNRPLTTFRNI